MTRTTTFIYDPDMINPEWLDAQGWHLFYRMPDAERAAVELTDAVFAALHAPNRAEAEIIARAALDKWHHVGAYDTEPRNLMMSYLDAAHGVEPGEPLSPEQQAKVDAAVDAMFAQIQVPMSGRR